MLYEVVIPERMKMGYIHSIFRIFPLTSMMRDYLPCGALLPLDIFEDITVTLEYIYQCLVSVSCCEECTTNVHGMLVKYCRRIYQKGEEKGGCLESCCTGNFYSHLTSSMKANLLMAYNQCKFTEKTKAILTGARRTDRRFERDPLREVSRGPISLYDYFEEDEPAQEFCDEIYKISYELRESTRTIIYDGYFINYKPFNILYVFNLIVRRFAKCSWKGDMLEMYYFDKDDKVYEKLGEYRCKCLYECEMIKDLVDVKRLTKLIGSSDRDEG